MSTDGKGQPSETEEVSVPRSRTLTEKGNTLYIEQQKKHLDKLTPLWDIVDSFLQEIDQLPSEINAVHNLEKRLLPAYEKYRRQSDIYVEFLQNQRTDQGTSDLTAHLALADLNRRIYEEALANMRDIANELKSNRSTRSRQQKTATSRSSRDSHSNYSTGTSTSKRQRAKAEAAKAKIAFAEKQAQILKQQAELEQQTKLEQAALEQQTKLEQAALEQQTKLEQAALEQQAKLEQAAREQQAKLEQVTLEQQAKRKQTELKVEFDLLTAKQEAASAEAAARALEEDEDHSSQDLGSQLPDQTIDPMDRVKDFVDQSSLANPEGTENIDIQTGINPAASIQNQNYGEPPDTLKFGKQTRTSPAIKTSLNTSGSPVLASGSPVNVQSTLSQSRSGPSHSFTQPVTTLNVNAPRFTPTTQHQLSTEHQASTVYNSYNLQQPAQDNDQSTVTRLLLQREALSTGFTKFKDNPESYIGWKSSFLATIAESQVSDRKQIELLVKWLGPESSKHAESIQMCSSDNPSAGIKELWGRLDQLYGAPEMLEASIKKKLDNFTRLTNKDAKRFYDLYNILMEIQFLKDNPKFRNLLAYFDSSSGLKPIVAKLPYGLQEKWSSRALNYKNKHDVAFPPFTEFCTFIFDMCKLKNDPSLVLDYDYTVQKPALKQQFAGKPRIIARKTEVENKAGAEPVTKSLDICILHKVKHSLNDCRGFKAKPLEERKRLLQENSVCYKCCESTSHVSRECSAQIKCKDCGSKFHPTALHVAKANQKTAVSPKVPVNVHGGEAKSSDEPPNPETVSNKCTEICANTYNGKSCAKILPVKVYHKDKPNKIIKMYAIIDEQSNRSLASSEFFHSFDIQATPVNYTLSTCSGQVLTSGQQGDNFIISSVNGEVQLNLPPLIECDNIPDNRDEIPTPEVVQHHSHLRDLASYIQPIDEDCKIMLLIGRDLPAVHHIYDQRTHPNNYNAPYAHKLNLGWVVIGETCLDKLHTTLRLSVKRTFITPEGQHTMFKPCTNQFEVREQYYDPVFEKTKDDDKPGMSHEDRIFLEIMNKAFQRNLDGNWVAPLPFKCPRSPLPNNRSQALRRAQLLDTSLKKNPKKREHFLEFMQKILDNNHAEIAPSLLDNDECWYLPLFGVYHPKKPDQIRGVFDSSAQHDGVSLNSVLLTGPDLSNSLLGVLLRFRREMVAVTADVQHMFHCFLVEENYRNYLRFFWYKDNDLEKGLIEYRMRVHVFGNSPSPAVATLGLRKTAQAAEQKYGSHVTEFVTKDFYVDDGLTSYPTSEEAIKVVKDTQSALKEFGNLRLHKFASNSPEVMAAFPTSDLATNLKDLDLDADDKPIQRSLGLCWDVNTDNFLFQLSTDNKPITRRGILSTINSIYDPLGFLAPVIIYGKLLLRELISETVDWDQPVSDDVASKWETWRDTLKEIETLRISRTYVRNLSETVTRELHVYSDASEKAIAAGVYLRTVNEDGTSQLGFAIGKAKVAPSTGHTIPRKELCAAVLGVEVAQCAIEHLDMKIDTVKYYTDSKVVLGYISNDTRRFYTYVANRVERIRKHSIPEQWNYVPTDKNPADSGTRSIPAHEIHTSEWLLGPKQLQASSNDQPTIESHLLVEPDIDEEVRPIIRNSKTNTDIGKSDDIGTHRFERFSEWSKLVEAIALLKHVSRKRGSHKTDSITSVKPSQDAEEFILRSVQNEIYSAEMNNIQKGESIPNRSPIANLNPFLDEHGLLRVGGRINKSDLTLREKKPIIVPGHHHITTLLIRHYHDKIKHQGRHFTDGAIRAAGLWITSVKRHISSYIHKCVVCRKLRGKTECQIMADLPQDRLEPSPPFTNIGVDVFGPWAVVARKTRGGQANSKRWAVLFTCLVTRAIHIELIAEMTSSAFINAFRRFVAIRGEVKIIRSDRGTNFIGAVDDLQVEAVNVEDGPIKDYLHKSNTIWIFNPPHSSHMGGVWERMIGVARRILDSMLVNEKSKNLTHDVLDTFMAEVSAIVNSRPLVPVSTDCEAPLILTPAMLLTQKTNYVFTSDKMGEFSERDLYLAEWRRVQALAKTFWTRWRSEYLPSLQKRQKWKAQQRDIKAGDVILLKDKNICRNIWPTAIVSKTFEGSDEHVRKAEVRVIVDGRPTTYIRPIADMILLVGD